MQDNNTIPSDGEVRRIPQPAAEHAGFRELQDKVSLLITQSKDPYFTEYLKDVKGQLIQEQYKVDLLWEDVIRAGKLYEQRKQPFTKQNIQTQAVREQPAYIKEVKESRSLEFRFGAGIFIGIGVLFIVIAFAILGAVYMNGFIKGMLLYGIAAVILAVSELVLSKRMSKLSVGITGMGLCGLYLSSYVNYVYLHNFSGITAMAVTAVTSLLFLLFFLVPRAGGRKRELTIVFMASSTVFTGMVTAASRNDGAPFFMAVFSLFIMIVLSGVDRYLIISRFCKEDGEENTRLNAAGRAVYASIYGLQIVLLSSLVGSAMGGWGYAAAGMYAAVALGLFLLFRKYSDKWIPYYTLEALLFFTYIGGGYSPNEKIVVVLLLFVGAKLLSRVTALKVNEMVITSLCIIYGLPFLWQDGAAGICMAGVFLLSVFALYHYKTFYEAAILFVLSVFAAGRLQGSDLVYIAGIGLLFLGMLAFNGMDRWRGRNIRLYNYGSLALLACWYLAAWACDNLVTYIILLLIGIAIYVLLFQDSYAMNFRYKYLYFSGFLTYMALICTTGYSFANSGLLMAVALGCVAVGFAQGQKNLRIYGLVLSMLVCGKVLLYDFWSSPIFEKMILFFIVGVVILIISAIYMILEKKITEQGDNL